MNNNKIDGRRLALPLTLSFVGFMVYNISMKFMFSNGGDLNKHIIFAKQLFEGTRKAATPVYYLTWGFFNKFLGISDKFAAAYADAFFAILCAVTIYAIAKIFLKQNLNEWGYCIVVIYMMFFGPLYFNSFSKNYYLGQGTFNTWHNPTNNSVKFISLIIFFLFVYVFNLRESKKVSVFGTSWDNKIALNIMIGVLTLISVLVKPSFFQVMAPTVAIVYLIDLIQKRKSLLYYIKNGFVFLPACGLILYQMMIQFFTEDKIRGGVEIALFDVWRYYSPNVLISIILAIAFPIFVLLICYKGFFKNKYLTTAFIFYGVSAIEFAAFAEISGRYSANFIWGMNLAIGILFLSSIFKFLDYCIINQNSDKKVVNGCVFIGYTLLSLHFLWGVWYYWQLMIRPGVQCF